MTRRIGRWWMLLGLAFLALATPVLAGGWATVTLDAWPEEARAGTPLNLGFMVKQHGQTPIDSDPFGNGPLKPLLIATNQLTGEKFEVAARKQGPVGHFVVDVTFPSDGTWLLEIVPPPFAGTKFEPLTVLAAAPQLAPKSAAAAQEALQPAKVALAAVETETRSLLPWGIAAVCLVGGAGLALMLRRSMAARPSRQAAGAPPAQRRM